MRRPSRDATITLGFVALSFALAFWQRPGDATSDTKVDLHVDPAAFLDRVLSAWNPSIDLGAVQTAQYSGFLCRKLRLLVVDGGGMEERW